MATENCLAQATVRDFSDLLGLVELGVEALELGGPLAEVDLELLEVGLPGRGLAALVLELGGELLEVLQRGGLLMGPVIQISQ